ncbi:V-type ATP synthase subunit K [Tubulinosema ratisbonensis]|uniref:V-type ATP synthase subunit K n=1 Tax=Tubulinosema ratisbonensis TaxID=291195 RepID=A0A437ALQ5_9MICR|nr:V-type ATP synthase subunit K [Tubulinosema ratisbonensis]
MDEKILSFVVALIAIGISTIVSCQACANALAVGGTSSSMYSQKRNTIVSIYISATISATIFLYAFICNIKLIYDLKKDMNLKGSFYKLGASIVYASTAYSVGEGIGKIVKEGMPLVEKSKSFFYVFFMMLTLLEISLLFSMAITFMANIK